MLEPEESLRLAESLPGVECLIVMADGRRSPERRLAPAGTAAARPCSPRRHRAGPTASSKEHGRSSRAPTARRSTPPRVEQRLRAGRQFRDQPAPRPKQGGTGGPTWPSGSKTRRENGPDAGPLGLDGRIRTVSMAPRPEALVSRATRTASSPRRRRSSSPSRGRPARPASTR